MRQVLPAIMLVAALCARAGNLERLDQVDLVELDAKTARAHLVVLLEEDKVNTRPAMRALFKKVNNYLDFVGSGQIKEAVPNASTTLTPKIVIYGPRDATSAEMQNLAGLKLAGQRAGVEVEVLAFQAGLKPRPIQIKPVKRGQGGA